MTQDYYGTKRLSAEPMTRQQYNDFRGWSLPADENGADEGYLVEYQDGGKPNVAGRAGYISWSPKEQFENAYQPITAMSFGSAVVALKAGKRVARAGWNGKGMWIGQFTENWSGEMIGPITMPDDWCGYFPFIAMYTADKKLVPWLASQTDILADDWCELPA